MKPQSSPTLSRRLVSRILLAFALIVSAMAATTGHADTYYLRGIGSPNAFDAVPVSTLSTSASFLPFLVNLDPSRDSDVGLMIQKGGANENETDPVKHQMWRLPGGELDLDGPVNMRVFAAMKGFDTSGKRGHMDIFLVECDPDGSNCANIKKESIDTTTWSAGWNAFDLNFGTITRTISPGRVFGVKAVVNGNSDDDMWLAYGSSAYNAWVDVTPVSTAAPEVNLQVVKSANTSWAYVGGTVVYTLQYNCVSTIAAGENVTITDTLDPFMTITGLTNSPHVASSNVTGGGRTATFTFVDPLPAGSSGEVQIVAEFVAGVADEYLAPNIATMSAFNGTNVDSNNVNVRAEVDTANGPAYEKGIRTTKASSSSDLDLPYERVYYDIYHGNTGGPGETIQNYVLTDIFPVGLKLYGFNVGEFPGTTQTIDIFYQTNLDASWAFFGTRNTDNDDSYIYPGNFSLLPGEYVSGLRFDFGTLPGGGQFHPDASGVEPIDINLELVSPTAVVVGQTITNCANVVAEDNGSGGDTYDEDACDDIIVSAPEPDFFVWDWDGTGAAPYEPGDTMRMGSGFGVEGSSGLDMVNPTIMYLLPVGFTYNGNESISGSAYSNAGDPAYNTQVIPDFAGSTRELVRLTFPGGLTIPATGSELVVYFSFEMQIVPGARYGWLESEVYGAWESPANNQGTGWRVTDTLDYDGDGNITEKVAKDNEWWQVGDPGSGVASIDSIMGVKGELDAAFSRFPDSGLTVPSGQADYELLITNSGGVALKDMVVIEILPHLGDRGVIDLSLRNSEWAPFLVGPVTGSGGMEVFYSTSGNPCRDELTPALPAGCDPPNWSSSLPADPTTVKSLKFQQPGGSWIMPGEEILIEWPMRAAINAPTNGEIAWSSFGVVATRADNNQRMLPSEPMKVGIGIQPPQPPFYGDTVWFDSNRDGIQDAGEVGINGVRVELYEDDGDGVADPNTDTLYSFTLTSSDGTNDGKYLFPYLPEGDYFTVFYVPDNHVVSPQNAGSDDDVDSDGGAEVFNGALVTVSAVTTISPLELDMSWDQGFYDRGALPAVWAIAEFGGGSVVIGGKFQSSHGVPCGNIAILGPDGSPGSGFNSGSGFDGIVKALAVTDDGKILVGGDFTSYDGHPANGLALLGGDGSWIDGLAMPNVNDVRWVGASGSTLYVAGGFTSLGGSAAPCIGRLHSNGSVDTAFQPGAGADGPIHCAAISGSGVIVGGAFSSYQGNPSASLARISADGSFDTSFNIGTGFDGPVNSITAKGGMVFAVGEFGTCNDHPANGAARLAGNGMVDTSYDGASSLSVSSNRASN